jgi:glyoxylase-like metal-dependent hydrolase (beta-lactamase superfamily II)
VQGGGQPTPERSSGPGDRGRGHRLDLREAPGARAPGSGSRAGTRGGTAARGGGESGAPAHESSHLTPGYLQVWGGYFPGQIPEQPVLPEALDGDVIDLEGHELRLINVGQSDTQPSTVVHVPDLDAVVGGDVCYNRIHMWLAQTDHQAQLDWIASIDKTAALAPRIVVAGHKAPGALDDDLAELLTGSKQYIIDFNEAAEASASREEFVEKMLAVYGDRGNVFTLWNSVAAFFRALEQVSST